MPELTKPRIYLIQAPEVNWTEMERYFKENAFGSEWLERWFTTDNEDIEALHEFAARRCYRSFEVGLNPNVTQVRTDSEEYFNNIKAQAHGCYDEKTEVLTESGWKRWPDVTKNDKLATRSENGELQFYRPRHIISYTHKGRMFRVESQGVDLLVTPDHKMLVCPTTTREGRRKQKYELTRASVLGHISAAYIKTAEWNGNLPNWSADELAFLGFAIGDGYVRPDARTVQFHLRRSRKISWLQNLLRRLQWHWSDGEYIRVKVPDHVPVDQIYTKSREKQIPSYILNEPVESLQGLFEGLMQSDGSKGRTGDSFDTTSELLAGQFQHLCLKLGIAANECYRRTDRTGSYGNKTLIRMSVVTRNLKPEVNRWSGAKAHSYWIDNWKGRVWCAEVPSHTLYVRRNGIPVWSGNSVLEHGMFTFGLEDVSRVFTAELDRHRAGIAISEQSFRYVRLDHLKLWFPDWVLEDPILCERNWAILEILENHQRWMSYHFGLEEDPEDIIQVGELWKDKKKSFGFKKRITSFMRRFAPLGTSTGMVWSCNARALRHVIEMRTGAGAEEEIRMVFGEIAKIMIERYPLLFGDYYEDPNAKDESGNHLPGVYTTPYRKV